VHVYDAIELVAARAAERGLTITRAPGDAIARTDRDRIRVVIGILLDNAFDNDRRHRRGRRGVRGHGAASGGSLGPRRLTNYR
jgi:hypothetical protein